MTPQQAIAAPRFNHHRWIESRLGAGDSAGSEGRIGRRGHQVVGGNPESFGGAHMILIDPESGAFVGGSDPRKGGCALGY